MGEGHKWPTIVDPPISVGNLALMLTTYGQQVAFLIQHDILSSTGLCHKCNNVITGQCIEKTNATYWKCKSCNVLTTSRFGTVLYKSKMKLKNWSITFAIILYILVLETLLSGCRDGESAQVANAMVKTKMWQLHAWHLPYIFLNCYTGAARLPGNRRGFFTMAGPALHTYSTPDFPGQRCLVSRSSLGNVLNDIPGGCGGGDRGNNLRCLHHLKNRILWQLWRKHWQRVKKPSTSLTL